MSETAAPYRANAGVAGAPSPDDPRLMKRADAAKGEAGEIFNVSDGHPGTMTQYFNAAADRLGLRLIHQELSLAPNLSVAENIFLGREPRRWGLLDRQRMFREAERLRDELGLPDIGNVRPSVLTPYRATWNLEEWYRK